MDLAGLFARNLLPVFLTAGAGWLIAATLRPDPRPISQVGLYVLAPCLIFEIVLQNAVAPAELARMILFAFACLAVPGLLAFALARWRRWPRPRTSALVLCVLLTNAGNYGMSVALLAFGERALAQAALFFLGSAIVSYTAGIFVASMGRTGLRDSALGLLRMPTIWAVVLAFVLGGRGWSLPGPVTSSVHLLASACIPVFLLVLGMQLRGARLHGPVRPLVTAAALRLGGGVATGLLLAPLFGLTGVARQAGVLQAGMPSAVIATILATEYDVEPGFVTSVVLLTTLLSPLTLTPLLAYLR